MNYFTSEVQENKALVRTAGTKARDDADKILKENGWQEIVFDFGDGKKIDSFFSSVRNRYRNLKGWRKKLGVLKKGDNILIQFPIKYHTVFLFFIIRQLVKKGIGVFLLIHDLETCFHGVLTKDDGVMLIMYKLSILLEEKSILKSCTGMIVHNEAMKQALSSRGYPVSKMTSLEIFDYLIPDYDQKLAGREKNIRRDLPVIIAGALRRDKAEYVYQLPKNVQFHLYGVGYEEQRMAHVKYFGSFPPDELPFVLQGSFGLVWDGDSIDTCSGVYGQYLKINNPHKTSLYLASGIPVIVWKASAMARFVEKHGVGIAVDSLGEISDRVAALSDQEYAAMLEHARSLSVKLRKGEFLQRSLDKLMG